MSTPAQLAANLANSQLSTGPRSAAGKAAASQNNFRHGLTGPFTVLASENREEFQTLERDLLAEHQPATATELILVSDMAQSHWLCQRAIRLQNNCLSEFDATGDDPKQLALFLRYQTTHHRAFYKALNELQRMREQKRKMEIGFVSQTAKEARQKITEERRQAQEIRRAAADLRAQELHQARVWLTEAHAERHNTETAIAKALKMPTASQQQATPANA